MRVRASEKGRKDKSEGAGGDGLMKENKREKTMTNALLNEDGRGVIGNRRRKLCKGRKDEMMDQEGTGLKKNKEKKEKPEQGG